MLGTASKQFAICLLAAFGAGSRDVSGEVVAAVAAGSAISNLPGFSQAVAQDKYCRRRSRCNQDDQQREDD